MSDIYPHLNSDVISNIDKLFPGLLKSRTNIFIFTNFRSGSTALADLFDRVFIIPNLPEMLGFESYKARGINMALNNELFLTSIMPSFLNDYRTSFLTDLTSYKIKLTRKDKISHICSIYIMSSLGKNTLDNSKLYEIPIDCEFIDKQIEYVLELDKILNNTDIKFDAVVDYSDIVPILKYSQQTIFPKPTNWIDLYNVVAERYNMLTSK